MLHLRRYFIFALITFLFACLCLLPLACSNSSNPSYPILPTYTYNTPTPAPSTVPNTTCPASGLCAVGVFSRSVQNGVTLLLAEVYLKVNNAPETTAGVTLVTPGGPLAVPYYYPACYGSDCWSLYVQYVQSWTYVPGGVYTLQLNTSLGPYSLSVTAPGNITHAVNGTQSSWTVRGNEDQVEVFSNSSSATLFQVGPTPGATPPVNIAASTYSQPGAYSLVTTCAGVTEVISSSESFALSGIDELLTTISGPPTATPTFTVTPTPGTPSPTPTFTFTQTFTPTFTATPTPPHPFATAWGPASSGSTTLSSPSGIGTDSSSNVYVVDSGNNRVVKYSSTGSFLTEWNGSTIKGKFTWTLTSPQGLAVDSSNNIYVVNGSVNPGVEVFNTTGGGVTYFGQAQLFVPYGIAVDSAHGWVYVVDNGLDTVFKYSTAGAPLTQFGSYGSGAGQFLSPTSVSVDAAGNVYVTDSNPALVKEFNSSGTSVTQFSGHGGPINPSAPCSPYSYGVLVESGGNIDVADRCQGNIQVLNPSGLYINQFASYGSGTNQLNSPSYLAADASGAIYVTDTGNNRVEKFSP